MVLQSSFGYPLQSYSHSENRYSQHGGGSMNSNAYYGNSSSMQMMRPDHYSHGGFSNHSSHGYGGGSNHSTGMYSHSQAQHGSMNHGYGSHQSSQMSMGPGGYQYEEQRHGHNISSGPFGYSSHSWSSKDLDD